MATYSIREHRDKNGKLISYYIRMYGGIDDFGTVRKAPFTTFRIPEDVHWSEETALKRAQSYAGKWAEEQAALLRLGVMPDNKVTFGDYARKRIPEKAEDGDIKHSTFVRYMEILDRLDPLLGRKKLVEITPRQIEAAIAQIRKDGITAETTTAKPGVFAGLVPTDKACPELRAEYARKGAVSKSALSRASGVSLYTVKRTIAGENISRDTAAAISNALGYDFDNLFSYSCTREDMADKTILEHFRLISSVYSDAIENHLLVQNPAELAKHPKCPKTEAQSYDPEDIKEILDALQDEAIYWRALITILIYSGARRGEVLGLSESDIDVKKNTLHISKSLLYSADIGLYIEDTTKTRKNRTFKVPQCVIDMIKEYICWKTDAGITPNEKWQKYNLLFTNAEGNPIHPDSINDFLKKFTKKKNLSHLHPHGFRHTAASTLLYLGADIVSVADMLGHDNPETTAKVYAHVIQAAKGKNANLLDDAFGSSEDGNTEA